MLSLNKIGLIQADQYLTHYWPILNGTMLDTIGDSHMIQGNLTSFASDRFGNANSALALNGGWTQVPNGIYFDSPEFTISVWVYPKSVGLVARVIDFGNGTNDNVVLALKPYINICSGSFCFAAHSSQLIITNAWQFLAFTYTGVDVSIYLNGKLVVSSKYTYVLPKLTRTNCYIGKSNWAGEGYSSSYIDDLRFYNKSLNQKELISLMMMNQTQTSKYKNK